MIANLLRINNQGRVHSLLIISLFTFCLFISSCSKDKGIEDKCNSCDCQPLPPEPEWGYQYSESPFSIQSASFNPNNDNELVYSVINYSAGTKGIYKYDITTQESQEIYLGNFIFDVEWGAKDWILFNLPGGFVWKVKSDGDSLTQLTFSGSNFTSKWNSFGDSILIRQNSNQTTLLTNLDGEVLKEYSDSFSSGAQAWNHSKFICSTRLGYVVLKNIHDSTILNLHVINDDLLIYNGCENDVFFTGGAVWENDNIYYAHELGILKSDINGTPSIFIKQSCSTQKYIDPSLNASKNKLLFLRVNQEVINENTVRVTRNLVTMNLDGSNETIIDIE